jgi:MFS family permease
MESNTDKSHWTKNVYPYFVFFLASLFYIYEFCLRVMPSTMTHQLMAHYDLTAQGLGLLAALFYFAYTPMQIPAGLLYDRFRPRVLLALGILLCAASNYIFGHASNVVVASMARLMIGFTSSFAFIGALLVASRWFPPRQFATLAGLVQLLGCLGAIIGEAPIAALVVHYGWLTSINILSGVGVALSLLVYGFIRTHPKHKKYPDAPEKKELSIKQSLKRITHQSQTWWIAGYAFCCWAPISIFATLWGPSAIHMEYHNSMTTASALTSVIWVAIGLGSPLTGWFSNYFHNRKVPLILCSLLGLCAFVAFLFLHTPPYALLIALLFIFGFSATSQVITFGLVMDNQKDDVLGTAIGFNNMAVICGGVLLQPLVGWVLTRLWQIHPIYANHIPVYSFHEYQMALLFIPACFTVGLLIALFGIKETHTKRVESDETVAHH